MINIAGRSLECDVASKASENFLLLHSDFSLMRLIVSFFVFNNLLSRKRWMAGIEWRNDDGEK